VRRRKREPLRSGIMWDVLPFGAAVAKPCEAAGRALRAWRKPSPNGGAMGWESVLHSLGAAPLLAGFEPVAVSVHLEDVN
jgi:hypothetical protein